MKLYIYSLTLLMSISLFATSCKSSKDMAKKSPIKTYVQPCYDLVQSDTIMRTWAMGSSDSETTARKKATTMAYADLAGMLEKTVGSMVEEYSAILSEGKQAASKELLLQKTVTTSNRVVKGARIISLTGEQGCRKNNNAYVDLYLKYMTIKVHHSYLIM